MLILVRKASHKALQLKKKIADVITESLKQAFVMGILPEQFFTMTPWQFSLCVRAYQQKRIIDHNGDAWMMWHGAALSRASKKIPELKKFLINDKKEFNDMEFKEQLRQLQIRRELLKEANDSPTP